MEWDEAMWVEKGVMMSLVSIGAPFSFDQFMNFPFDRLDHDYKLGYFPYYIYVQCCSLLVRSPLVRRYVASNQTWRRCFATTLSSRVGNQTKGMKRPSCNSGNQTKYRKWLQTWHN
jgi:hypothetical protein